MKRVFIFVTDFKGTSLTSSKPQLSKTVVNDSELVSTESKGRKGWHIKDTASFRGLVQQFISLTNASEGNFHTMRCLVAFLCKRFTAAATGKHPPRGSHSWIRLATWTCSCPCSPVPFEIHCKAFLRFAIMQLVVRICNSKTYFPLMSPIASIGYAVAQIDSQKTLFSVPAYIYFFFSDVFWWG